MGSYLPMLCEARVPQCRLLWCNPARYAVEPMHMQRCVKNNIISISQLRFTCVGRNVCKIVCILNPSRNTLFFSRHTGVPLSLNGTTTHWYHAVQCDMFQIKGGGLFPMFLVGTAANSNKGAAVPVSCTRELRLSPFLCITNSFIMNSLH